VKKGSHEPGSTRYSFLKERNLVSNSALHNTHTKHSISYNSRINILLQLADIRESRRIRWEAHTKLQCLRAVEFRGWQTLVLGIDVPSPLFLSLYGGIVCGGQAQGMIVIEKYALSINPC
jgi:hypothetical protein